MTPKLLKNSTALALVSVLCLPIPHTASLAQQTGVDCAANPGQDGCAAGAADDGAAGASAPAGDATGEGQSADQTPDQAPSQVPIEAPAPEPQPDPQTDAPAADAAPQAEEAAPVAAPPATDTPEPAQVPEAEEAAPAAEKPAAEAVSPPASEAPPADAPPAESPPAEAASAEAPPAEASPADAAPADAAPGDAPEASEETGAPASEAPAPEVPAGKPEAPAVDATPAGKPAAPEAAAESTGDAPEEVPAEAPVEAPAEAPADKPAAPAEDTVPEAKPAPAGTGEGAAETAPSSPETPEAAQSEETPAPAAEAEPAGAAAEITGEPGEPIAAPQSAEPAEPAIVVEDDASDAQRAEIKQQEERRREEARDRRLELLGAAAVGAGIGMLIPALGGKVVEDQGDRIIVERDGDYYVRKDENSLLRSGDAEFKAERLSGGRTRETVTRRNGVRIVTLRDEGGYVLYRARLLPDGREVVLIDNRHQDRRRRDWDRDLPPLEIGIPRERYIVPAGRADYDVIYQTFTAPPVEPVEEAYSLRDVRENERLRDKVRRVDLDTITFDTGSAVVRRSQVPLLEDIARASVALIEQDPSTVLLVEGHTDAVGPDIANLALSDRRAETVARILAEFYGVPPENMVVQGYGEDYLKIETEAAEERNRRVTIRNITPLLSTRR